MIVWPPDFPVWGGPWPLGPLTGYTTVERLTTWKKLAPK